MAKRKREKTIATLKHDEASRKNIPTAEFRSVMDRSEQSPVRVAYERRNRDLDPQLVWRGKDEQDWSDLVVQAPPLYIQEKVHPKILIDDLRRRTQDRRRDREDAAAETQPDLFADFNGLPDEGAKTEFYQHDANWSNRMILGDSLQVMASLAEREGLRGKVQCIYLDPPYGIKFNSNFQWSTTSRDVKDGKAEHISREPEQVKAFRDTWRDGVHSYLTYLRDRLTVSRDLLAESGSIFVQIGDENVHRVRALMDEVFGEQNFCSVIVFRKTTGANSPVARVNTVASVCDYVLWYSKRFDQLKYRQLYLQKDPDVFQGYNAWQDPATLAEFPRENGRDSDVGPGMRLFQTENLTSTGYSQQLSLPVTFYGRTYAPTASNHWKTTQSGLAKLFRANRLIPKGRHLNYRRYLDDFGVSPINNIWNDIRVGFAADPKVYVVQTSSQVVARCNGPQVDFAGMILDQFATAGVQQAHRAGIFVGPEFGTVSRPDLVAAAREAGDAGFDVLIACAFNYEAHASEFDRLGRIPVLKARMNADLHMAGELKNTGKGNLFVVFGEPDIDILPAGGDGAEDDRIQVKINGVDVFHPNTGEVRSDGADGIACWFIDTDYNEESFFVRHAYFLGANDPYKALKTTLKAEIDPDAWASLHSDVSRPFDRPESGRIAVKVINHLGDEVMKVFRV